MIKQTGTPVEFCDGGYTRMDQKFMNYVVGRGDEEALPMATTMVCISENSSNNDRHEDSNQLSKKKIIFVIRDVIEIDDKQQNGIDRILTQSLKSVEFKAKNFEKKNDHDIDDDESKKIEMK